ncbi:ATP-binding protein [bacterium]|nr:ATP-binding protein [bacterium]
MRRTLDGKELEVVMAGWDGSRFETFCNALLLADAPTPLQHFPRLTDRGNVADGGIDAEFDYDGPATRLLSPGRNVFQCKWRSPYDHKAAFNSLLQTVPKELSRLSQTMARYTLVTNLNLSGHQQAKLLTCLREVHPAAEVVAAGGLAAMVNNNPVLQASFFPESGEGWQQRREQHDRFYNAAGVFVGREQQVKAIEDFLKQPDARVLLVSGPAGIGKSALLLQALKAHQSRTLYLSDPLLLQDYASQNLILVIEDIAGAELERWIYASLANLTKARTILVTRAPVPAPIDGRLKQLAVGPLSPTESESLLSLSGSDLSGNQRDWVVAQSGGFPLPLVLLSRMLPQQLDCNRSLSENLLPKWEGEVRKAAGNEGWLTLQLCSLLAAFSADPDVGELEALATALGYPTLGLYSSLEPLDSLGFFERNGRFLQVRPKLLADFLAQRLLGTGQNNADRVLGHLHEPTAERFLERILSLDTPGASALRKSLLSENPNPRSNLLIRLAEKEPETVLAYVRDQGMKPDLFWLQRLLQFPKTAADALRLLGDYVQNNQVQELEHLYLFQFYVDWPSGLTLESRLTELKTIHSPELLWKALVAACYVQDLLICDLPWTELAPHNRTANRSEKSKYLRAVVSLATAQLTELSEELVPTALHFLREAAPIFSPPEASHSLQMLAPKAPSKLLRATLERLREEFPDEPGLAEMEARLRNDPMSRLEQWLDSDRLLDYESYELYLAERAQAFTEIAQELAKHPQLFTDDLARSLSSSYDGRQFLEHLGRASQEFLPNIPPEGFAAYISSYEPDRKLALLEDPKFWTDSLTPISLEILARCPDEEWAQNLLYERALRVDTPAQQLRAAGFWRWTLQPQRWLGAPGQRPELAGWLLELLSDELMATAAGQELAWQCLEVTPPPWLGNSVRKFQAQRIAAQIVPLDPSRALGIFVAGLRSEKRLDGKLPVQGLGRGQFFQALLKATPTKFLATLFDLVTKKEISMFHFSQELRTSLEPDQQQLLLDHALSQPEHAAAVAFCLDSNHPGFWDACDTLLSIDPGDTQVEASLYAAVTRSGESFWGQATDRVRRFLDFIAEPLEHHPSERLRGWLTNVQRSLDEDLQRNLVWEYDLKSREFEQSLAATGTPAQKWAVKRLVEQGNLQDVRRRVSPEILARYLPDLNLPPKRKQALEKALEFWLQDVG